MEAALTKRKQEDSVRHLPVWSGASLLINDFFCSLPRTVSSALPLPEGIYQESSDLKATLRKWVHQGVRASNEFLFYKRF